MQEAQRFLRYVIPGLIFFIELLIFLLISQDIYWKKLLEYSNTISFFISALLASGGIGFLFGVIYYTFIWKCPFNKRGADHRQLLKDAVSQECLELKCGTCNNDININKLSQRGAWRLVLSYWAINLELSKRLKGALQRADRLADIAHSLGTIVIASGTSVLLFWIFHLYISGKVLLFDFVYFLFLLVPYVHYINFRDVVKDHQDNVYLVLMNEFKKRRSENFTIPILYVSPDDMEY